MKPTYEEYAKHCHIPPDSGEWPRIEFNNIQTGRTTRMMAAVEAASCKGLTCYVIVKDRSYAAELKRRWRTASWPTAVFFHTFDDVPFDPWKRDQIEVAHPFRRIFISHEAIEHHRVYRRILMELHRYDRKPE